MRSMTDPSLGSITSCSAPFALCPIRAAGVLVITFSCRFLGAAIGDDSISEGADALDREFDQVAGAQGAALFRP